MQEISQKDNIKVSIESETDNEVKGITEQMNKILNESSQLDDKTLEKSAKSSTTQVDEQKSEIKKTESDVKKTEQSWVKSIREEESKLEEKKDE